MLGSYYQTQNLQAIGDDFAPSGSVEAARAIMEMFPGLKGSRYTVWGSQSGETRWIDLQKKKDYLSVPVTPKQLEAAENAAGGHAVGYIAVALKSPLPRFVAEELFTGTPYTLEDVLAVYRQDDLKPVPTPTIFLIGRLRDQSERPGTYVQLARNAEMKGGRVMFLYHVPPLPAPRPRPPFRLESVLNSGQLMYRGHGSFAAERKQRKQPLGDSSSLATYGTVGAIALTAYLLLGRRGKGAKSK